MKSGTVPRYVAVMEQFHGTTILSVRRQTPSGVQVAIGGDGQVTLGNVVVKGTARKIRRLHHGKVIAGFAGATADAFTLFERFEAKLEKHQGHLVRAAIELTKDWRTDRVLRRLEAMLAVADLEASLIITGNGDVLEPEQGIVAIGSGGVYAQSAAKALIENTDLSAEEVVRKSLAVVLLLLGMLLSAGAAVRWLNVERSMRHKAPLPLPLLAPLVTVGGAIASGALVVVVLTR